MRHGNWGFRWRSPRAPALGVCFVAVSLVSVLVFAPAAMAEDSSTVRTHEWILQEGSTTIVWDNDALSALDLRASLHRVNSDNKHASRDTQSLVIKTTPGSTLTIEETPDDIIVIGASLRHSGKIEMGARETSSSLDRFTLADDGMPIGDLLGRSEESTSGSGLWLRDVNLDVDASSGEVVLFTDMVTLSPPLAAALGVAGQVRGSVATVTFRGRFKRLPIDADAATPVEGMLDFDHRMRVTAGGAIGPDVVVLSLPSIGNYGSEIDPDTQKRISAYAVATTSCNRGDEPAIWKDDINQHPVIAQNLYRLKDDQFEQIGMSWLKHGFFAVRGNQCGACVTPPGVSGEWLGVSCSDPYSANLNGTQNNLGPRSAVNPYTGFFPYPFNRAYQNNKIDRRLQVGTTDVDPDLNAGALYFVEGHYVNPDDAQAGNHFNNASFRPAVPVRPSLGNHFCNNPTLSAANDICLIASSFTREQQSALHAWKEHNDSVHLSEAFVPGEGEFEMGVSVTNLEDGFWRYEYAVYNLNSDRAAGSVRIPIPEGAAVRNLGFHAPFYHSGELYDDAPWTPTVDTDAVIWSTTSYEVDENANALRWGTLYNFRLDASVPPEPTSITIGLFRPGSPSIVTVSSVGPAAGFVDCNANLLPDICDVNCSFPGCDAPCGTSADCNGNSLPDECEPDCNENDIADQCDITSQESEDCDGNSIPDECDPDCDDDGTPDACEVDLDSDDDGVRDCDDLCPDTTPVGLCLCPQIDTCCFDTGFCIPNYPRSVCIAQSGTPDCQMSPCRDGCLVGDWDEDGDLDLYDLSHLLDCFTGFDSVGQAQPSAQCVLRFDFDDETDIDVDDFRRFRDDYTGP